MHIDPQPFEAEFLGGEVWRLRADAPETRSFLDAVAQARSRGVRLISCRIPAARSDIAEALGVAEFRKIETLLTFERDLGDCPTMPPGIDVGPVVESEIGQAVAIGRSSFTTDRFHADRRIPRDAADALKARWVENGLRGRADAPLVARVGGRVVGFNLCVQPGAGPVIDLIAVAAQARGLGIGKALVAAACHWYVGRARTLRVGTQADNLASTSLYRSTGFVLVSEETTFHWMAAA